MMYKSAIHPYKMKQLTLIIDQYQLIDMVPMAQTNL